MGRDSYTLEQSLWIRNAIADLLLEDCGCYIYPEGTTCLRCDSIQRASRLFPIQHAQAVTGHEMYMEKYHGVQP